MKRETWNSLRDWLVRVGILLFTLVLCLGLFEIGCRILGVDFSPNPGAHGLVARTILEKLTEVGLVD